MIGEYNLRKNDMKFYSCIIVSLLFPILLIAQDYHVAAYYYPWYGKRHWNAGYWRQQLQPPQAPLLGEYSSKSKKVIQQHLEWSAEYGIDSWICSWWGQGKYTDRVLKRKVLPEMEKTSTKMALFYESEGILGMERGRIMLDSVAIHQLGEDIRYMSKHYFPSKSYLKIGNRPVLFFYLTRAFVGRIDETFKHIRQVAKEEGYDIFLVGDEVFWQRPNIHHIRLLDAVTPYNMHGPGQYAGYPAQTGFLDDVRKQYYKYEYVAKRYNRAFIPNAFPGFNDQGVRPEARHYAIPPKLSVDDEIGSTFRAYLELSSEFADSQLNMITITSFNEWHEDTQIEPSMQIDSKEKTSPPSNQMTTSPHSISPFYPSYGFIYLDLIKAVF